MFYLFHECSGVLCGLPGIPVGARKIQCRRSVVFNRGKDHGIRQLLAGLRRLCRGLLARLSSVLRVLL